MFFFFIVRIYHLVKFLRIFWTDKRFKNITYTQIVSQNKKKALTLDEKSFRLTISINR